jgi:hypothetical protein
MTVEEEETLYTFEGLLSWSFLDFMTSYENIPWCACQYSLAIDFIVKIFNNAPILVNNYECFQSLGWSFRKRVGESLLQFIINSGIFLRNCLHITSPSFLTGTKQTQVQTDGNP